MPCRFKSCSAWAKSRSPPCMRPASAPLRMCASPARRCCGVLSASTAGPCATAPAVWTIRPVQPDREEQSISAEQTFAADIDVAATLRAEVSRLADKAASRLRAHDLSAGTVSVKIRRKDFTTYTRQRALTPPTQDTAVITAAACRPARHLDRLAAGRPRTAARRWNQRSAGVEAGGFVFGAARAGPAPRLGRGRHPQPLRRSLGDACQPAAASRSAAAHAEPRLNLAFLAPPCT